MDQAELNVALDYAPAPAMLRRRRVRIALALIVGAILLGAALWKFAPLIERMPNLYWQWRCMRFAAPAEKVAYEEDETRAAALASRTDYRLMPLLAPPATQPIMSAVGFVPPPFARFIGNYRVARPTAFVGSLTLPDGQERLVAVELNLVCIELDGHRRLQLEAETIKPGSLQLPALHDAGGDFANFNLARIYRLRLYWGQRDPQRPDRFTIRYVINDYPGVIEGRLGTDHKIKFSVLEGPLANRLEK